MLLAGAPASANVALTQVSTDPFTNTTSQHQTEVEPDTFAASSTIGAEITNRRAGSMPPAPAGGRPDPISVR